MRITCALTDSQIEKLYANAYGKMLKAMDPENPTAFDSDMYMQDMFNMIAKAKDDATAAKFAQQLPSILIHIAVKDEFLDLDISTDNLRKLARAFKEENDGIITTAKYFNPEVSPEVLLALVESKKADAFEQELVDPSDAVNEARLRPYSIFTGTLQEFVAIDPKLKSDLTVEVVDESKKRIYNALNKIKEENNNAVTILDNMTFQGRVIKLKAVRLTDTDKTKLDDYTNFLISRSIEMQAEGKARKDVTQAQDMLLLVMSDKDGNELYFDEEGNITTKDQGKLVYQFIRDVRLRGNQYVHTNMYGYDNQLTTPETLAKLSNITVEEATELQQKELEQVYNFKNEVLKNGPQVIDLVGISPGVSDTVNEKNLSFKRLQGLPIGTNETFNTIRPVIKGSSNFEAGGSTITLNGKEFPLERPVMSRELAIKIAAVLTNPNISLEERYDFIDQFLSNKISSSVRRHYILYKPSENLLGFQYDEFTINQKKASPNQKSKAPYLSLNDIDTKSEQERKDIANTIYSVLMKASSNKTNDKFYPTKFKFSENNLDTKLYRDYDVDAGEFIDGQSYIEFIKNQDASVKLNSTIDPGFFNSYVEFRLPTEFTKEVNAAKDEVKKADNRSFVRRLKDDTVEYINANDGMTNVTVRYSNMGISETTQQPFAYFTFTSPFSGQEGKIYLDPKYRKDESKLPKLGDEVYLVVENTPVPNIVRAYNADGDPIGNMQETDYDANEAPRDYSKKEETKEQEIKLEQDDKLNDDIDPSTRGISSLFERTSKLPNNVTREQIDAATEWWKSSPLADTIPLEHLANIVNSNAYARFIVAGKKLTDVRIQVNAKTGGNMVDVYHEAWHAFSQLFLTKDQKTKLYNEFKKNNPEYKDKSFFEVEEAIAEEFRNYALDGNVKKGQPVRNTLFRKILNFIKKLLGMISEKDILFQNLYFAGQNPKLLNDYTPLIDNVMFDTLNRGPQQVGEPKKDALNRQDGNSLVTTMDSIWSQIVDQVYSDRAANAALENDAKLATKAGTIKLLLNENNKQVVYSQIKNRLIAARDRFKKELGSVTEKPFNTFTTLKNLEDNALAVMKIDGVNKYVFLSSQIDSFDKLNLATKNGDRVKGQTYDGVDIISDFYNHTDIVDAANNPVEIVVVANAEDANVQYNNYVIANKGYESLTVNERPELKPLSIEEEGLLNKIRILETAINNWGNATSGMVKYHIENSRYEIIRRKEEEKDKDDNEDDADPIDDSNLENSVRAGKQDPTKLSVEEMASKETIYILKSLHKKNRDGSYEVDMFGFRQLADFRSTWNNTLRTIGGIKDPKKQMDLLAEASASFPEFTQLLNFKLPDPLNPKDEYEMATTTGFYQDFGRLTQMNVLQLTLFNDGGTAVVEASVDTNVIQKRFINRFKSDTTNEYITKTPQNISVLNINKVVSDFKNPKGEGLDTNKSLDFARAIGIYLDDLTIINNELTGSQKQIEFYGLPYIYDIINKLAKKELEAGVTPQAKDFVKEFKLDPLTYLASKIPANVIGDKEESQKTQIERLLTLQVKYGSDGANFSAINAEGNSINRHIKDNTISMYVYGLNSATKLSDLWTRDDIKYMSFMDPKVNPFTNRLATTRTLFDLSTPEALRRSDRSMEFFLNSGTQQEALEGTSTTSLDIYSKYLQDIHTMLQGGMIEFIRAASKSSSFGTRIDGIIDPTGKKKNDPRLWIDIDRFASGTAENYAFNVHFLQYIAGEYDRITKFKANKDIAKTYKGYNRKVGGTKENPIYAGETFIIFDKVLTPTTKKDIMSKVGAKDLIEYLKTDPDLKTKIYNDVVNYFNEQVEQNLKMLSEAEYISADVYNKLAMFNMNKEEAMDTLIKAFTYNSWIQNFETVMIFLGDPAEVNHDKEEEHKRNTMAQSNGPGFRTDQGARNFINGYAKETSYAQTLDEKYRVFNFDGTFDTAIAEDVKRTSVYIDVFKEKLTEYYTKKLSKSTLKNKEQLIKDKVENDLSKYTNMEEGDGQGYITFDAYRTLKILENDWDWNEQEKLFQKIVKGERIDPDSIVKFFSPYKIQNYGRLANANLILPITAGHKFEVVPLIPSVIEGSDWQSLHLQMLAANKQYITYSTGSKIGSITSEVDKDGVAVADEIYEPGSDKKVLKKDIKFTSNKVYLETVKKVTNVAVEYKKKGIFPTQMRVLVLDGMFENGELVNPDDAPLVDNYVNSVSNLSDIIEKELLNDIGYTFKDGKVSGDLTRFMKVVQRELERKNLPQHLIKFIGVNPDNTLKIDLSLHPNADEIEKILTNLIEKPLIKQKVKGEGLLQIASSMTNGIWDKGLKKETVADVLKFIGTNNLPFYHPGPDGKTLAMKIAISLQGDFANLLNLEYKGERIATREILNVAIKDDEWLDANDKRNRQAITLSGVRIPTDSKSQMEFAEVYEFLDPAAGNIVILPTEMVGKTGGDYDGDKLTTQMPHISKKGNFIRRKWSEKELNDKVEELKAKGKNKEAAAIIKLHKKVVENELISSIRGILEIPEYYVDLIKPTSTDTLEGIADELQDFVSDYDRFQRAHGEKPRTEIKNGKEVKYISPTNIFEVGYNLHKHQANLDAARPLGITAVENKLSALLNSIGAKMPDKYKFAFYSDPKGRWIETDQIYKMRLFLPHNKVNVNGVDHISISGIDSVDKENVISVLNTQLLNGFLDVEKKPWPFYIQGNLEIVPMLINLLQVGVPVRDAIYFVSNPMVREYAKQQRLIKSKFAHLIGKSVDKPSYTQYKAAERTLEKYGPYIKGFVKPSAYITNKTYYTAVTKATGLPNVLNADGYFDSNILRRVVEEEGNLALMPEQFAMFLHFLELEKEFKGYQALKRQFNPDTKTSKTLQEIIRRDVAFEDLDSSSKIDKETKRKAREESLLTSFFDASKVVVDVVKPLFPFRNNDKVTDFIIKALQARSNQIRYNYRTGREATSKFITDFKNAVTTAMFQKSVGTIFDPNGEPMTFERMVSAGPNSYSAMVFDVIEKLPKEVKDKYPVLQQLSPILLKSGQRVLTLNDRKQAKGDLADIYYQNLKELSNVNVRKVANTERNQYISQIFQMLPLVTVYQNGVGYSAYGFNSSLPYDEIIDVLQAAADDYIKHNMTEAEFVKIINKLAPSAPIEGLEETRKKSPFKNYNASDAVIVPEMPPLSIKFDDVEDSDASDSELPTEKDLETGEVVAKRTFGAPKQPTLSTTPGDPVSQTNKPKGKQVKEGIYVNQGALTNQEQLELFNYLKPYLEEQAARTLKGSQASKMIGLGLRWDYKNNNTSREAVDIPDVINPGNKTKYGYYDQSINGQPLGQITPRFRELMQKATGIDMTNYDGAIINLYEKDTFISSHNDVDESRSAIKYPVIGINIGGKGNFSIERLGPENERLDLEAGTGYIFGVDGINREVWHRTFPTPQDSFLPELTTKIDGKTYPAGSYRITITMRRVMPLTEGMPKAPAIVSETTQPTIAPATTTNNPAEYTNHSGGATGSDTQWDVIGKEFGMVNNRHYFTGEKGPKNAPLGNVDITDQPIAVEGASKVAQAAKQMWGYKYNTMKDQRLIRNWAQVANSDAVFAIGTLGKEGDIWKGDEKSAEPRKLLKVAVQGGTGYAVEMAIQAGKRVYVFDQVRNQWYKNINGEWSKSEVPTLTKKFAGIGTREINEAGKQAIRDVYENTFKATQSSTSVERKTYSGRVTSLQPNQIFVFGSNPEGRHGKGAAKDAKDLFGAKYGQGRGMQGQSYALVTKNLKAGFVEPSTGIKYEKAGEKSVSKEQITNNIKELYSVAAQNPTNEFLIPDYSVTNLNGYTGQEMADMFKAAGPIPSNIVFNENFDKLVSTTQPNVKPVGEVKEGVVELFEAKPNLSQIGTPQQYSEWINYLTTQGKLGGTQATEILYHGSDQEFDTFDKTKRGSATGDSYFQDEEQTPIDSLNAFFFSTEPAVSEQYGLLRRVNQVQSIATLLQYGRTSPERYKSLKNYSPELADHLREKQKELNAEDFSKYLESITLKYSKVNDDLGEGFLIEYSNYIRLGKQLKDIQNKKQDILSGKYVHNTFSKQYPNLSIYLYDKPYDSTKINEKGKISRGKYDGKNIIELTETELDDLLNIGNASYKKGIDTINSKLKKAKITPILYRVLLNVQKPLVKDFENKPFVDQAYEAGAKYEASKLTNQAAKSKGQYDSVIFKNILDPYLSDNYGVFEPEQVYILGGTEDMEGFKNFVSTKPTVETVGEVKTFKNSLFRGQENKPVIDANGNLILVSTYDSLFKSEGVSFAEDLDMARGYGLRYSKNPYIIEIDADYADTIFPLDKSGGTKSYGKRVVGDQGEQRFVSKEDVIIPKGKFKITRKERTFNFETFTPEQLIEAYNKQFIETDVAEYNRYGEVSTGYATEGSDYYDAVDKELLRRGISKDDFLFLRTANTIFSIEEIVADAYNIKAEPGELIPDVSKKQIQEFLNKQANLKDILKKASIAKPTVEPLGEVKEGVLELFDANPELSSIGTEQQYSQYLNSIFPDSKVKDIVYHGTNKVAREGILKEGFREPVDEELEDMQDSLIWFSKDKNYYYKKEDKTIVSIPALVNIKFPNINSHENFLAYGDASGIKAYNLSGDGLITQEEDAGDFMMERAAEEYFSEYGKYPDNYNPNTSSNLVFTAVPTAKQIHILGSKQDIEGFKRFVSGRPTVETVSVKLINDEDIARFKAYVEKAGGLKPKEFFTASTKFSIFYNSASGRKEGAPQESKWLLNIDGMYDLVDQITGEIYLTNVDLLTGTQTSQPDTSKPVSQATKNAAIKSIQDGVKNYRLDEIMAVNGYDYKDIISNLEAATTEAEFNKIINKILKYLC